MAYKVLLTKTAYKAYNKTTGKLKLGIDRCLSDLEITPNFGPGIKKLKGLVGCFRYQIGGLRLIYEVHEDLMEVRVYSIRPRGDVYKH
ncbi:MAG: type II toxin-antitoxin system RelE/ParE family toxin [Desulfomonilaceae bacterium]|jgi:mRNA interferase RelE/StbE